MTVTTGPDLGLLINADIGEEYYAALTSFLRGVDGLVQPRVFDKDLSAPPGTLANGAMYIVGANPTGAWAGKAGQLARWFSVGVGSPAWEFYAPKFGWSVRVLDELDSNGVAKEYVYGSAGWVVPAGGSGGGGVTETYTVVAPSGGTLNLSNPATTIWGVNLNANVATVTLPSNLSAPTGITLIITQDSTGGRTITWPSNVTWNGAAPTIKSTANGKTMLGLLTVDGGATWLGTSIPVSSGGGGGMVNPMTAKGSLIVGGTAGAAEELLVGAAGQVLTVSSSGTLVWTTPSGGGGDTSGLLDLAGTRRMTGALELAAAVTISPLGGGRNHILDAGAADTNDVVATLTASQTTAIQYLNDTPAPAGSRRVIRFDAVFTLEHNPARITLPGGRNIVTAVGDRAMFRYTEPVSQDSWVCEWYTRADGTALVAPAGGDFKSDGSVRMTGPVNEAPAVTLNVTTGSTASIYPVAGNTVSLNSTVNIESFGEAPAGVTRRIYFQNSMTLKRSSILETLTNGDIVTRLGDWAEMYSNGGGFWVMMSYTKKDGTPLVAPAGGGDFKKDGSVQMTGPINNAPLVRMNLTESGIIPAYTALSNTIQVDPAGGSTIISLGTIPVGGIRRRIVIGYNGVSIRHSDTLSLPGGVNITTAQGDSFDFESTSQGTTGVEGWRMVGYLLKSGRSLISAPDTSALDLAGTRTMTGPVNEAPIQDVRSYSDTQPTTNLAVTQSNVLNLVQYDASITSFGTAPLGFRRTIVRTGYRGVSPGQDTGPVTLVHNATSLRLPGGANITTSIGDSFEVVSLGGGNWFVEWYQKANGRALVADGFTEDQVRATLLTGLVAATGDVVATDSILAALGKLQASKVAKVDGKGLSTNDYTADDKSKLANIQANATANSLDSFLLARANHTGTQVISTINGLPEALNSKVDIVAGKGLSTNDYTTTEKNKLAGIAEGAQVNSITSVAGRTGAVTLAKADVGLSNVDNTADTAKPVSGPQQTALNAKAAITRPTLLGPVVIAPADSASGDSALVVQRELINTDTVGIPQSLGLNFLDKSKAARLSAQLFRLTYNRDTTATGSPTAFDAMAVLTPSINANAPYPVRGLVMEGPAVGSGLTLQSWTAMRIQAPSGAGSVSSKIALMVDPNAGNSIFGALTDNGTDIVQVAGSMSVSGPVKVGQYTLSTLPSAAAWNGYEIDVTNATNGPKRCRSNGTNWLILNTTTPVS